MLWLFTAGAIAAVVASIVFLVALARSDGDLLLMFKAKYGKQPESLAGKVVWITGASSGIGEYIAYCLADAGCRLVLSARRKEELERVKLKCLQSNKGKITEGDILILPLDVVAFDTHKVAVKQILDTFNKIDILVNNAGRSQRAMWTEIELGVDRELFETNVLGPVSLTQEVLPHMMQRKQGHVVVISSAAGKCAAPTMRSYATSKHAIHGSFETLRAEMGQHNIDVTLVCPGPVDSNIRAVAATGKTGEALQGTRDLKTLKVMATDRCAYLTCVSIANRLYEAWIADQPVLTFIYIFQYIPNVGRWFSQRFGARLSEEMKAKSE